MLHFAVSLQQDKVSRSDASERRQQVQGESCISLKNFKLSQFFRLSSGPRHVIQLLVSVFAGALLCARPCMHPVGAVSP